MVGETIAHYRIVEKLGSGGMGDVYKAEDTQLKRYVALKFLPREVTLDEEAKQRFIHEAQAASALDHVNVGTIFQISESKGRAFMVMACYEGGSLKDRISEGPVQIDEAVEIASQICRGLSKAHAAGIVHRDIKPANVMLTDDGQVKIVDFGLAKLAGRTIITKTGATLGTVAYMSPEQVQGAATDYRTDLWSLGVLLHEMLVGQRPFKGEYDQAVVYSILNTDPEFLRDLRPEAPPDLERVIEKALEKNPDRRYKSADEFLADLDQLSDGASAVGASQASTKFWLGRRQRRLLFRTATIATTVIVVLGLYLWLSIPTVAKPVTIAVLPLISDFGDEDTEWFSDGVTDALITDLAQIDNLRVISRISSMRYKGTDKSLPQIAEELNVAFVLDVSASKTGDIVKITTRLADAETDQYIWSGRFESEFSEVLDSQSQIAIAVAKEIHGELSPGDEARLSVSRKINPQVYEAYLRGMHHINKLTPTDISKGLAYLHEAVELDPADPFAWTGLASGYITVGHGPSPVPDVWQRARAAAERAVTLDSTLAEARSALATVKLYHDWDWDMAEREFKLANELNPNLPLNHYHYAWYLLLFDRLDEAIVEYRIAEELDPLNPLLVTFMTEMYRMAGRYEEAERQAQKALNLGDGPSIAKLVLGWTYLDTGREEEAVVIHEEMAASNPIWKGFLGTTYARVGRTKDAERIASEIEAATPTGLEAVELVFLYTRLGNADKAFEWANHIPHHSWLPWLASRWSPLHSLKDDPRYGQLLARLNLPGYDG